MWRKIVPVGEANVSIGSWRGWQLEGTPPMKRTSRWWGTEGKSRRSWQVRRQLVGPVVRMASCPGFGGLDLHLLQSKCRFVPVLLGPVEGLSVYITTFLISPASASLYQLTHSVPLCYSNLYSSLCFPCSSGISWLKQPLALLTQILYDHLLLNNQLKSSKEESSGATNF